MRQSGQVSVSSSGTSLSEPNVGPDAGVGQFGADARPGSWQYVVNMPESCSSKSMQIIIHLPRKNLG